MSAVTLSPAVSVSARLTQMRGHAEHHVSVGSDQWGLIKFICNEESSLEENSWRNWEGKIES